MRKLLKEKRQAVTDRFEKEQAIAEKLLPFLFRAKSCGLHMPIQSEVNIMKFLPADFEYALPKMKEGYALDFYPGKDLVQGPFGVMEPVEKPQPADVDLVVVPLLGFNKTNRVGYGKGYYDRWLEKHPDVMSIGIAFDEQEEDFPPQPWDQPLKMVITPTRIICLHDITVEDSDLEKNLEDL